MKVSEAVFQGKFAAGDFYFGTGQASERPKAFITNYQIGSGIDSCSCDLKQRNMAAWHGAFSAFLAIGIIKIIWVAWFGAWVCDPQIFHLFTR